MIESKPLKVSSLMEWCNSILLEDFFQILYMNCLVQWCILATSINTAMSFNNLFTSQYQLNKSYWLKPVGNHAYSRFEEKWRILWNILYTIECLDRSPTPRHMFRINIVKDGAKWTLLRQLRNNNNNTKITTPEIVKAG